MYRYFSFLIRGDEDEGCSCTLSKCPDARFQLQCSTFYGHSFKLGIYNWSSLVKVSLLDMARLFTHGPMKCFILCELILNHLTKETVNG